MTGSLEARPQSQECAILKSRPIRCKCSHLSVVAFHMPQFRLRIWPRAVVAALAAAGLGTLGAIWFAVAREPLAARPARLALAQGRYDDGDRLIAGWLGADPESLEAHLLKGRVAVGQGRLPEAVLELKHAQSLGAARNELSLLHALIASKAGRHTEAEPALRQAFTAATVPDRQIDEALAKTYLETYDLPRATEVLDRWSRDFPTDAKPYLWRAEVDGRTASDPAAAENDYREALRRDVSLAGARLGLAEELRKAHRNGEARREYDLYLARVPDNATAHLGAGRNLMELGDERLATEHLNRAIALDGTTAEPLKELSAAATRRGDWTAAITLLDRAIALDPHDVAVHQSRGLVLAHVGRAEEARAEQAAATRLRKELDVLHAARSRLIASPHDRQSQFEIARWMFDHGHDQEGARWAEKILTEAPDDVEASRLLARYHDKRGETGLANYYRTRAPDGERPSAVATQGR
jgi:tetratricopeptide (TPR) repeat protein